MSSSGTVSFMTLRRGWAAIGLAAALVAGGVALVSATEASAAACQVAAAGDIGETGGQQQHTGDQVRALAPQYVLALGDLAYENGSTADFAARYNPAWGSFRAITKPAPGNHEYQTANAAGYFAYFSPIDPYYAFDVCGWRLYSLNSELTGAARSTMVSWFAADSAAHAAQPRLAYWHKPRWSDGTSHGNDPIQQDLWSAAATGGTKVVLNGHEHLYTRFAEMNAAGAASAGGTREFVVGTGGAALTAFGAISANDQRHVTNSHGVMLLTLRATGYDWKWADWDGSVSDVGTLNFPAASPSPSVTPTTASPSPTCAPVTTTVTAPAVTTTVTAPAVTVTVTPTPTPFVATLTGTVTPPV